MWYLIDQEGHYVYLKPNQETVIGRKKGGIILSNDKSISKEHALISVAQLSEIKSNEPTSMCQLKDLNSKYGTFILREEEIIQITETEYNLKHQDKIRFGLQHHIFKVINLSIITITSTLHNEEVETLKNLMEEIDGVIIDDNIWRRASTYLTVGKAVLTLKLACAMASALPIVTMKYWDEVKFAVNNGQPLPDPNNFVPPISEVLVTKEKISVSRNEKRTKLFENLTFVHFSVTQYKKYKKVIKIAGGESKLFYRAGLMTAELCARNIIVLQYPDSNTTQSADTIFSEYNLIKNALQTNNRRMISEAEIPLAILHCSTEKYCNSMYKFAKLLKRQKPKCDSSEISNLDTQNLTSNVNYNIPASMNIKQRIIPETSNINSQESLQSVDFVVIRAKEKENYDKSRNCDYTNNTKQQIIPETLNLNSQESLESVDFVVTQAKEKENYDDKSRNCDYTNIKHVIPETSSTINSQKSHVQKSNVDFIATQPAKKQKYDKYSHYMEETPNDDVSATIENVQITQSSNENNSTFASVSSETAQYSNDNQNLHKHKNVQDEKQLQELTTLNGNETESSKVIQQNENNIKNSDKDLIRDNSDDLTSSNSRDKNREKQSTTCSIDSRITPENLKETIESHSSISEDSTEGKERENFVTSTQENELSLLRVNCIYKTFKKAIAITPQERINIDNMYMWNKWDS